MANLAQLGISIRCWFSVRSQYLVRLLSFCWITGVHIIHPTIEGVLPPTGLRLSVLRLMLIFTVNAKYRERTQVQKNIRIGK